MYMSFIHPTPYTTGVLKVATFSTIDLRELRRLELPLQSSCKSPKQILLQIHVVQKPSYTRMQKSKLSKYFVMHVIKA